MRVVDAEEGMVLIVRGEHRGRTTGSAVAKVKVVKRMSRGNLHVKILETYFGCPACLRRLYPREAFPQDERRVESRYCWPWTEGNDRGIAARKAAGEEAQRRRAELEGIVERIGAGTVANNRVFFEYEEMIDIAPCIPAQDTQSGRSE